MPDALSAAHLSWAVVPLTTESPQRALRLARDRIDLALQLSDANRVRLPWFPLPPRTETLAELVQAARRRLQEDRSRVDVEELGARRLVVDRVLRELEP
jgi:hypothetical protein